MDSGDAAIPLKPRKKPTFGASFMFSDATIVSIGT